MRYYNLRKDPAAQAGNMGSEDREKVSFWAKAEYLKFSEALMDKPQSYYAFEMLYWCGLRVGKMLTLTPADFNFKKQRLTLNKSYQRIKGEDQITSSKTKKSNRIIKLSILITI